MGVVKIMAKKSKILFFSAFAVALLVGFLTTDAGAARRAVPVPANPKINTTYALYAGGLRVVDVTVDYNFQPTEYDVYAVAQTRGFWASLVPWRNVIKSYGSIDAQHRLRPNGARYDDVWREKARTQEFSYKPDGSVNVTATPPHKRDGRVEASESQRKGAIDPLSAVMSVLVKGGEQGCHGKIPSYDGRRVYNLVLTNKGTELLNKNRYSIFQGVALRCEVTFEPIAGFPPRGTKTPGFWSAQNNEDKNNPLIIWIAKPSPNMPELPVRVQSTVELGTLVAHIRAIDQTPIP